MSGRRGPKPRLFIFCLYSVIPNALYLIPSLTAVGRANVRNPLYLFVLSQRRNSFRMTFFRAPRICIKQKDLHATRATLNYL